MDSCIYNTNGFCYKNNGNARILEDGKTAGRQKRDEKGGGRL